MSTGPGPTRKADGSHDVSVDDVVDFLVDDDGPKGHSDNEVESGQILDDGLDVMLETPGPVLVNSFMPPPPAPAKGAAEEDKDGQDESSSATNLAYEDLLAKLVLPAKPPSEPEPAMPAPATSLPLPDLAPLPYKRPSSPSFLVAPPTDERTLVTENPLLAEEQEAAAREGRTASREIPNIVREQMRPALTEPMANGAAKSRLVYLMLGGLLILVGMILGVVVLKLIMPAPAPVPVVVSPAPALPPPAPPTRVEPLPPTEHLAPAAAVPTPPPAPVEATEQKAAAAQAPSADEPGMPEAEESQPKAHRTVSRPKSVSHVSSPKPSPAAKPAAPAKAQKPAGTKKSGKASQGWVDPFDN